MQKYLGYYEDWHDTTEWAYHKDEKGEARSLAKEQQDPTLKEGIVGDFCRAYSISEAIEKYLSDVYEPTDKPDRWTYTGGSTSGGMLTFDDSSPILITTMTPYRETMCSMLMTSYVCICLVKWTRVQTERKAPKP